MRSRPRGPDHGAAGAGRRCQGPDVIAAVSRAMPGDEDRQRPCHRHRRLPRRQQRPRLHRQSRTHLRLSDRDPVGSARGVFVGAGRGFRHPQSRRHRRRSRRRVAGTDRRARQPRSPRRDAAARKPGAAGHVAEIAEARRAHRQIGSGRRRISSRPAAAARFMRSAAPGGRWPASTSSRAVIPCG